MDAMHYAIRLPADYDMRSIRERVASKGPLLDNFPGLGLKAYLVRQRGDHDSPVNEYAPFYLWASGESIGRFLWDGGGFGAIVSSFGRPPVRHWLGVDCRSGLSRLACARIATLREYSLDPDIDPAIAIAAARGALAESARHIDVCLSALAVNCERWAFVQFTLWAQEPPAGFGTRYDVLHLSTPHISAIMKAG